MNKLGKPFLAVEIVKGEKGANKFPYTFLNNNSEVVSGELSAEAGISEQIDLKAFKTVKEIYCILPADVISFKTLNFPFKLRNGRQILSLIGPALEEQNPLLAEDLSIAYTRLNDNSVFVEYIRKDKLNKINAELGSLIAQTSDAEGNKIKIKFFSPYSLLYKISAALNLGEPSGAAGGAFTLEGNDSAYGNGAYSYIVIYRFNGYFYGILFENNNLKDVVNFNLPFNADLLKSPDYLNIKAVYLKDELRTYLSGKNAIKRNGLPGSFAAGAAGSSAKKGVLSYIFLNSKKIFVFCAIFLFLIIAAVFWQVQSFDIKSGEKTALQNKINSILTLYMPGKKVFYEPRSEIKNYYGSMKKNSFSENAGIHFLNLLSYVSASKLAVNGVGIDKMDYSIGRFALTGTVQDYKSLNKLEKYLKKRYSDVTAANSVKTEAGVSFTIYLKNK